MKRSRFLYALIAALFLGSFACASLGACSKDDKKEGDDKAGDDDDNGKKDGGKGDDDDDDSGGGDNDDDDSNGGGGGVIKPDTCSSNLDCPGEKDYCDPDTLKCVTADYSCEEDYQCPGAPLSFCDKSKGSGMCRSFRVLCQSCQQDSDCAYNPQLGETYPNRCIPMAEGSFCGWNHGKMACPPGFTDAKNKNLDQYEGQCVPQSYGNMEGKAECSDKLCDTDDDCPFGDRCVGIFSGVDDQGNNKLISVCTSACVEDSDCQPGFICNFVAGICTPRCDPTANNNMSNCGTGKACHIDGRCGDACPDDEWCAARFGNTYSGELICSKPQGRCRISGCERDSDCGSGLGIYCDIDTAECIVGCRTNEDCPSMMICVDKGFAGTPTYEANHCSTPPCDCMPPPCTSKGGAIFCGTFQFCCGENNDITCPDGIKDGECYPAPIPPYCAHCDPNDENSCPEGPPPGGYDGNCYELQDQDGNKIGNYCANLCRDDLDCPTQVKCIEVEMQQQGGGTTKQKICDFSKCRLKNPHPDDQTKNP